MSHLTRHVRAMHEKRKDHACPHCAAAFGQANNLTTHVRTVHEKRRDHACPHCTYMYVAQTASYLTKHVRTQHLVVGEDFESREDLHDLPLLALHVF